MDLNKHLPSNIKASMYFLGCMVLGFVIVPVDYQKYLSVIPRELFTLPGAFTMPFVHITIQHLASNLIPLTVMMLILSMLDKTPVKTVIKIGILGSLILWAFGRSGNANMGASVVLFGLACYLVVTGLKLHRKRNLAASITVIILYGASLAKGLVPQDGVSWDGHIAGVVAGFFMAMQWNGRGKSLPTKKPTN